MGLQQRVHLLLGYHGRQAGGAPLGGQPGAAGHSGQQSLRGVCPLSSLSDTSAALKASPARPVSVSLSAARSQPLQSLKQCQAAARCAPIAVSEQIKLAAARRRRLHTSPRPSPALPRSAPQPASQPAASMDRAAEEARAGNLQYFHGLPADQLAPLVRSTDDDGRSLFHSACASGSLPLVQFLLDHGAAGQQAKQADEEVSGAYAAAAAAAAHPEWVEGFWCPTAAVPSAPILSTCFLAHQGWTPLHSAVSAGHEPVARLLLSLGADPNAATEQQRTSLHYAASKGQAALVQLLLQAGAAPGAKDSLGATALHRAAATGAPWLSWRLRGLPGSASAPGCHAAPHRFGELARALTTACCVRAHRCLPSSPLPPGRPHRYHPPAAGGGAKAAGPAERRQGHAAAGGLHGGAPGGCSPAGVQGGRRGGAALPPGGALRWWAGSWQPSAPRLQPSCRLLLTRRQRTARARRLWARRRRTASCAMRWRASPPDSWTPTT